MLDRRIILEHMECSSQLRPLLKLNAFSHRALAQPTFNFIFWLGSILEVYTGSRLPTPDAQPPSLLPKGNYCKPEQMYIDIFSFFLSAQNIYTLLFSFNVLEIFHIRKFFKHPYYLVVWVLHNLCSKTCAPSILPGTASIEVKWTVFILWSLNSGETNEQIPDG